jgi:hypothetical protein
MAVASAAAITEVASEVVDSGSTADSDTASDLDVASDLDAASGFTLAIPTFTAGMGMAAVPTTTASTGAFEHTTCRTLIQIEGTSTFLRNFAACRE